METTNETLGVVGLAPRFGTACSECGVSSSSLDFEGNR